MLARILACALLGFGCGRIGFTPLEGDVSDAVAPDVPALGICATSPPRGTICPGGGIYAGEFDGRDYLVTAPGCDDAVTPTCTGEDGNFGRTWDPAGARVDIPQLTNVVLASAPSPASERGDYNTPLIIVDNPASAAGYCSDLVWGGYTDWYLPSKSELVYIFCRSLVSSASLSLPESDPGCTSIGGHTNELTGWSDDITRIYWSSSENSLQEAWTLDFRDGTENDIIKNNPHWVRCVRSF